MGHQQLQLLLHAVLVLGIALGIIGAFCIIFGSQFKIGNGPFVRSLFLRVATSLQRKNFRNWPRAMIGGIISALNGVSAVIGVLTVLTMLLLPFWFVHVNAAIFSYSAHPENFEHYRIAVKTIRDGWFDCAIVTLGSALVLGISSGYMASRETQDGAPSLVFAILQMVLGAAIVIAGLYLTYKLSVFYWGYYPVVLRASLSGTLRHVLLAQIWMFPVTISAISFPLSIIAPFVLVLFRFRSRPTDDAFESFARGVTFGAQGGHWAQSFSSGVSVSFILSAATLIVGTIFAPSAHPDISIQLLVCNAIFDGLTLAITLAIFRWVVSDSNLVLSFRLLVALVADLTAAAALAVASLYFSLFGTRDAMSLSELRYILIGHSAASPHGWDFGPYFWLMHSSFLPTLIVWFVIVSATMIALTLTFLETFVTKPAEDAKPLAALGGLLTAWGVVFGVVAYLPS